MTEFFAAMIPPTVTHQEKKITIRNGKPHFYDPPELKEARAKLRAHLAPYRPEVPYEDGIRLIARWCFPIAGNHRSGEYRTTKPDTDNLQKLLKDVMTGLHFWKDDAQVACEVVEKFWADTPGLYVAMREIYGDDDG